MATESGRRSRPPGAPKKKRARTGATPSPPASTEPMQRPLYRALAAAVLAALLTWVWLQSSERSAESSPLPAQRRPIEPTPGSVPSASTDVGSAADVSAAAVTAPGSEPPVAAAPSPSPSMADAGAPSAMDAGHDAAVVSSALDLTAARCAAQCPVPLPEPQVLRSTPAGVMLQLGVFGDADNAARLQQRLAAAGFEATLQSRVVLGPFPDRAAAEAAQRRLDAGKQPSGILLPPG